MIEKSFKELFWKCYKNGITVEYLSEVNLISIWVTTDEGLKQLTVGRMGNMFFEYTEEDVKDELEILHKEVDKYIKDKNREVS